jgi:hypothetical protein
MSQPTIARNYGRFGASGADLDRSLDRFVRPSARVGPAAVCWGESGFVRHRWFRHPASLGSTSRAAGSRWRTFGAWSSRVRLSRCSPVRRRAASTWTPRIFPALHTQGDTLDEAIANASEALEPYVDGRARRPLDFGVVRRKFQSLRERRSAAGRLRRAAGCGSAENPVGDARESFERACVGGEERPAGSPRCGCDLKVMGAPLPSLAASVCEERRVVAGDL